MARSCSRRATSRPWWTSALKWRRSWGPKRSRRPRRPTSHRPTPLWRTPSSSAKGWPAPSCWRFRRGSRGGACGSPGVAL
eukprot:5815800-Alexandrium_andersonii.AAC.1